MTGEPIWTPRVVAVWQRWEWGRWTAFKTHYYGPWHLSDDGAKTVIFTDDSLQEVMARAQAIEAHWADAPPTCPGTSPMTHTKASARR